jgi:hypothetical protein
MQKKRTADILSWLIINPAIKYSRFVIPAPHKVRNKLQPGTPCRFSSRQAQPSALSSAITGYPRIAMRDKLLKSGMTDFGYFSACSACASSPF